MTIHSVSDLKKLTPSAIGFPVLDFQTKLLSWYEKNHRQWPWRLLWNREHNIFHVWVSEIMLQQTVIKAVLPVYQRFLQTFPTIESFANATDEQLRFAVRGLGYYRRFKYMHETARKVVFELKGHWPRSYSDWLKLPGIGEYTAAAITSIAFSDPNPVIDGNVERVMARIFDVRLPANDKMYKKALKQILQMLICIKMPGQFNQALMELGQEICVKSASAKCNVCPVSEFCLAKKNNSVSYAPAPKLKLMPLSLTVRLTIVKNKSKYAMLSRPQDAKFLKSVDGFLTEIKPEEKNRFQYDGTSKVPFSIQKRIYLGSFSHTITKHRLSVQVFLGQTDIKEKFAQIKWLEEETVEPNLLANLDRKAWQILKERQRK